MEKTYKIRLALSSTFLIFSIFLLYLTYYFQLRVGNWPPSVGSGIYFLCVFSLAIFPLVYPLLTSKSRDYVLIMSTLISFLLSFIGTFEFFYYLYIIYILDIVCMILLNWITIDHSNVRRTSGL